MNTTTLTHEINKNQQIKTLSELLKELDESTKNIELTEPQKHRLTPLLEKLEDRVELQKNFLTEENNKRLNKFGTILTTAAAGAAVGATLVSGASIAAGTITAGGIITNPVVTTALGTLAGGFTGFILNSLNRNK